MSKFQSFYSKDKNFSKLNCGNYEDFARVGWNAACKSILAKIRYKNKAFEGNWQHEDIDYLIEEIQEIIEKD